MLVAYRSFCPPTHILMLRVCLGVGGVGPGGHRGPRGEAPPLSAGLGEELQGPESQGEGVGTPAQVGASWLGPLSRGRMEGLLAHC